jgi:hypothetical protein
LKNNTFYEGLTLLIMTVASCESPCNCETIDRKAKDGETLYEICRYVVDNKQLAKPANPCEWTIRESKDDNLNRKRITRVTLTCCYMGDQAIINKETNKVLEYIPSDK